MADAAVEFLLGNLKQLLVYHTHLIRDVKHQVEKLEKDLRLFKAFLKEYSAKKRRKGERLRELVSQIRDVVYEAEDIIDAFVTQAAESRSRSYFPRVLSKPVTLLDIAKQVEIVAERVNDIYNSRFEFASRFNVGGGDPEESEAPVVRQENVVGFEDEVDRIKGYLSEETERLDVISIIGMPGLGKTTLTGMIFRDPHIQDDFPIRIWVYVSQNFTGKNIFLAILKEFTSITEDMHSRSAHELAQLVAAHLETSKFLLVMDDVWTTENWDEIQIALPKSNKLGKVLITSRHAEVARHANRSRPPHNLRFFTQEESWLLLRLEVFGKPHCPPELEVPGKLIVDQCGQLPLAIVVIGGILVKKSLASNHMIAGTWMKVSARVHTYLDEDPQRRMEKFIAWSYNKLPYHLKACFLYLGIFPEDFEISVSKLIRMWIAEGFVQQKNDISLEETAENYLEELINRNLVRIDKIRLDGRVKTCRIHDMLRDFCKKEATSERENFLQEIKKNSDGVFVPPISDLQKYRRLCIHSNVSGFISSKPFGHRVRSFVCFSEEEINPIGAENISVIPAAFKLLRVLEVKPIKFAKIPRDMYQLVHLRYITLSSTNLRFLPSDFSQLWNIQTLVVDTTHRTLEIKANIWKMMQLRHFKTNASMILPEAGKHNYKGGEKLQTLGTISPKSCTKEVFDKARNLKKLGIRGQLNLLLNGKLELFASFGNFHNLEKLKLLNDVFPIPPSEGRLHGLPPAYMFPPKLRYLTLADTFLNWTHMSIIGLLENLLVLKLKDKAFMGRSWEAADGGFRRLELLHIGRTDLVVWKASGHHFPRLRHLHLHNCGGLHEIPIGIADIPTLELLDLYHSRFAAASAKRIEAIRKVSGFKLSIFPHDE